MKRTIDTLKIDMRDIISKKYQYGKKIHGALAFNGHELASCKLNLKHMDLTYSVKIDGFLKFISQEVPILWQSYRFGSKDAYFICPVCWRKTLVLYHRKTVLTCRQCCELKHKLQCAPYEFVPNIGQ